MTDGQLVELSTASMEKSSQTTQDIILPHHTRDIPSLCVETIEQSYRERGFLLGLSIVRVLTFDQSAVKNEQTLIVRWSL